MKFICRILVLLAFAAIGFSPSVASATVTLDRHYKMGDDSNEGAVANQPVGGLTLDSVGIDDDFTAVPLEVVNAPTYRTIAGRPDNGTGFAIEFNAAQQEYLHGPSLGDPSVSVSSTGGSGVLDYEGIFNRGLQFWVRPTSTAVQTIVMDTNQHGVRINSAGNFSMRYSNDDFDSGISVTPNTWYHIEVVRPFGAAGGSRMYINGVATAVGVGGYDDDLAQLVVGANTAGDEFVFSGGTEEFFSGIVDDLKLFVMGTTTSSAQINYGTFNLATDNDFIASPVTGLKNIVGDVTNNGVFDNADKTAFIAGWLHKRVINGVQLGDLVSRGEGDLNLDGITDIKDLVVIQSALAGAGLGAITAADLQGVPEPATFALLFVAALLPDWRHRRRAGS